MIQAFAALLIGFSSDAATVTDFRHDVRGDQTCVVDAKPERCLKTLDLGNGLDLLAQTVNFDALFDETGKSRDDREITKDEYLGAASGVSLSPAHRKALVERFAYLKVNRIAANLEPSATTPAAESLNELPFLAEVEWAPKADPNHRVVTFVEGRLTSDGKDIDLSSLDAGQLNTLYAGMVRIDRVSTAELGEDVLRDIITPAVLGNETAQIMLQLIDGFAEALGDVARAIGEALSPQSPNPNPNPKP